MIFFETHRRQRVAIDPAAIESFQSVEMKGTGRLCVIIKTRTGESFDVSNSFEDVAKRIQKARLTQ